MSVDERWRPIPDFPDYEVSDNARIRNIRTGRLLKPVIQTHGYLVVMLHRSGTRANFRLHRLVAQAFCPGEGELVRHLDGDRLNNNVDNLAWGTQVENMADLLAHGRHWNLSKTHCPHGHEYTPENTVRDGCRRRCKTCRTRENQARTIRRRARVLERRAALASATAPEETS